MSHTPGPWELIEESWGGHVHSSRDYGRHLIAECRGAFDDFDHLEGKKYAAALDLAEEMNATATANARLIAKAPDMLAGLVDALDVLRKWGHEGADTYLESEYTYAKVIKRFEGLIREVGGR